MLELLAPVITVTNWPLYITASCLLHGPASHPCPCLPGLPRNQESNLLTEDLHASSRLCLGSPAPNSDQPPSLQIESSSGPPQANAPTTSLSFSPVSFIVLIVVFRGFLLMICFPTYTVSSMRTRQNARRYPAVPLAPGTVSGAAAQWTFVKWLHKDFRCVIHHS